MKLGCIFGKVVGGGYEKIAGPEVDLSKQRELFKAILLTGKAMINETPTSLSEVVSFLGADRKKRIDIPVEASKPSRRKA